MTDDGWGATRVGGRGRRWRERLLGGPRRLGWWTLPLFVAVGLLGAVLAGSLTAVYYAQKVAGLERQTAEARRELAGAVERVSEAAEEARAAIESEVNEVREALAVELPLEEQASAPIVSVRAEVVVSRPPAPPEPQPGPSGEPPPPPQPAPPPRTEVRFGSGFAVVVADGEAFFVTSYQVVADPLRDGEVPVERAEVLLAGNRIPVTVHAWDPPRDLALLRATDVSGLQVPEWRPAGEPLETGDKVFAVGRTPAGALAQVVATVAAVDENAVITDAQVPDLVQGGPLLDAQGRVVGVASVAYSPYGQAGGAAPSVPVRLLCQRVVRCGAGDLPAG